MDTYTLFMCLVVTPVATGAIVGMAEALRRRYYKLENENDRTIDMTTPYGGFLMVVGAVAVLPSLVFAGTVSIFIGAAATRW